MENAHLYFIDKILKLKSVMEKDLIKWNKTDKTWDNLAKTIVDKQNHFYQAKHYMEREPKSNYLTS